MKYLLSLAFRNLWNYKRRTILTFLILSVGIMLFIMMSGILKGFDEKSFQNQIDFETGHFKVRSLNFDEERPYTISNFIKNNAEIEKVLASKAYITAYTERLVFNAELDNGRVSTPVQVIGADPNRESTVFITTNFIEPGRLEKGGAVIGKTLAQDMDVIVGDRVFLTFRNAQGVWDSVDLLVSGIINAPNPQVNTSTVYMDIEDAKRFLNTTDVAEIVFRTKDYNKYKVYEKDLAPLIPNAKLENWMQLGEDFIALGQAKQKNVNMLLFFIALIGMIGIINTMLMSVYEKKREIGTLKALGMTDKEVQTLFVIEGLIIGLLGSTGGIILGSLGNLYFVLFGMNLQAMMGNADMNIGFKVLGTVYAQWDIKAIFGAFMMSLILSTLASYYPAKKATKLQPAECLRTIQ